LKLIDRARDRETGQIVALKRIRLDEQTNNNNNNQPAPKEDLPGDGFPVAHYREILLLQSLQHPNIVRMQCMAVGRTLNAIFIVMEYAQHDLSVLIDTMKKRKYIIETFLFFF
jgi:cell division cycle 2-like protein